MTVPQVYEMQKMRQRCRCEIEWDLQELAASIAFKGSANPEIVLEGDIRSVYQIIELISSPGEWREYVPCMHVLPSILQCWPV